jgi:hypothetical protein
MPYHGAGRSIEPDRPGQRPRPSSTGTWTRTGRSRTADWTVEGFRASETRIDLSPSY